MKKFKSKQKKHSFPNKKRADTVRSKALTYTEEKILRALKTEEVHDWGARRLLRKSGVQDSAEFYFALHCLKD